LSNELNRRELLRGGPPNPERICAPDGRANEVGSPRQPEPVVVPLGHYRFDAMGCQFELFFPGGLTKGSMDASGRVASLVAQIENEISVYRPGSTLSRLNAAAARQPVPVSGHLATLLPLCLDWHAWTGGAFDCTLGPLARAWGFRIRQPRMPEPEAIAAALEITGTRWLEWTGDPPAIRFLREGMEVDFNGIGKGHAMQEAAGLLSGSGQRHFLVHGGQSSVVAAGNESGREGSDKGPPGWRIGIADPLVPRRRLAEVRLVDQALATSGSGRQALIHNGRRYGHVLDPRTGWPASHWLSATVIHTDPTVCDVLSTAVMVMSEAEVDAFAAKHPAVGIVNAREFPDGQGLELKTWNLAGRDVTFDPAAA
jgi:FAD:protein FMN transferase